jgi:2'-5' RNA ligase
MSPFPDRMRDRWADRHETAADRGMVYWHVLLHSYPEALAAATEAQEILAHFDGFHLTPLKWLHMTTLVAGTTDEVARTQMSVMVAEARRQLRQEAPIPVTLGKVLYHPEAIMVGLRPAEALQPILEAAQAATLAATGRAGAIDSQSSSWVPHMTVGYSTAEQPAAPIISTIGRTLQERQTHIDALTLVVQWGPERLWNWEPVGTAHLHAAEVSDSASPE